MQVNDNEKKNKIRQRKKVEYSVSARYPSGYPERQCQLPTVVDVIIVTMVITMTKVDEKKGVQGYVSGFLFLRKASAETAATAVTALCFSLCHKRSFLRWSEFMFRYYP